MEYTRINSESLSDMDILERDGVKHTIREWCILVEWLEDNGQNAEAEAEVLCKDLEENGWPM